MKSIQNGFQIQKLIEVCLLGTDELLRNSLYSLTCFSNQFYMCCKGYSTVGVLQIEVFPPPHALLFLKHLVKYNHYRAAKQSCYDDQLVLVHLFTPNYVTFGSIFTLNMNFWIWENCASLKTVL